VECGNPDGLAVWVGWDTPLRCLAENSSEKGGRHVSGKGAPLVGGAKLELQGNPEGCIVVILARETQFVNHRIVIGHARRCCAAMPETALATPPLLGELVICSSPGILCLASHERRDNGKCSFLVDRSEHKTTSLCYLAVVSRSPPFVVSGRRKGMDTYHRTVEMRSMGFRNSCTRNRGNDSAEDLPGSK